MDILFWSILILGILFTGGTLLVGAVAMLIQKRKLVKDRDWGAACEQVYDAVTTMGAYGFAAIIVAICLRDFDLGLRALMASLGIIGLSALLIQLVAWFRTASAPGRPAAAPPAPSLR